MEQHTIDFDEKEHYQQEEEECIEIVDQNEMHSDEPPCIFRVHEGLRNVNEKAYTPMLVSIGPYHHGQPKLLPMEKHKQRYLELLLQRNNQREEDYLESMKKMEKRARNYYANPVDHDLDSEKFVKMMLNDACFITEFLRGKCPIVKLSWMKLQIYRDLMLLENQLPFFVISEFYSMSCRATRNLIQNHPTLTLTLANQAMRPINQMLQREIDISKIYHKNTSVSGSKHFLDLVHNVCLPSELRDEPNDRLNKDQTKIPCVRELKAAVVKFDAEEEGDELSHSMFDIHFNSGHFKIPKFQVTDDTETFFRNIIAYEQHSSDDEPKYFTDYTYLMDQLINSNEDVNQLCCDGVLENWLGDDKEVAVMFNKLGIGRNILPQFYYAKECIQVNHHYRQCWNRNVATLRQDYFKNIWVTVATIAAAFLLLLTVVQTVIALITFFTSSSSLKLFS